MDPGTEAVFTLKATGENLYLQWQKDCSDIDDCGTRYCGTHTNTLRIFDVEKSDKGRYRCCVNNNLVSEEAILTVCKFVIMWLDTDYRFSILVKCKQCLEV